MTPQIVQAIALSKDPDIYLTALPGRWLLSHATPSWRIRDPEKGFQRIVNKTRAKAIRTYGVRREAGFSKRNCACYQSKRLSNMSQMASCYRRPRSSWLSTASIVFTHKSTLMS